MLLPFRSPHLLSRSVLLLLALRLASFAAFILCLHWDFLTLLRALVQLGLFALAGPTLFACRIAILDRAFAVPLFLHCSAM